jgi:hypothetical protein
MAGEELPPLEEVCFAPSRLRAMFVGEQYYSERRPEAASRV